MLIGYARCSTDTQDLTPNGTPSLHSGSSRTALRRRRPTGANRARPGLREALAACRAGQALVVTKLDRLARSLKNARDIVEELTTAGRR